MDTKFGIVAPLPGVEVKDLINFAKKSEDAGLDSVWYPDHILFMAKKLTPEVWSVITGASVVTEKIQLGAIGDPHRMHPATMAHRLATVGNKSTSSTNESQTAAGLPGTEIISGTWDDSSRKLTLAQKSCSPRW